MASPEWFRACFFAFLGVAAGCGVIAACDSLPGQAPAGDFPELFRIECVGQVEGCECLRSPDGNGAALRVYHAEAATGLRAQDSLREIQLGPQRLCWYPRSGLRPMPYAKVLRSRLQDLDHAPIALKRLAPAFGVAQTQARQRQPLGAYWATYYHLAVEDFHPGPRVPVLNRSGQKLGEASREFLRQVMWQGSGISSDGLRLHYTGTPMRFNTYARDMWGHGAGFGYRVFPYRTIAVNFASLCQKLMPGRACSKKDVIGVLVYIREVAARHVKMPDGSIHDGYFCATDTGSPNYIKSDRIDIFVGTHGGGNPYLPPARRPNHLIAGGIANLVPSDWRLWRGPDERVWCDPNRVPLDPAAPAPNDCVHDYHVVARHKALHLEAVLDSAGAPLRCAKNP